MARSAEGVRWLEAVGNKATVSTHAHVPARRVASECRMTTPNPKVALALLAVETVVAVLALLFHYSLTTEYGDVTASTWQNLTSAFKGGLGLTLVLVAGLGVGAFLLSSDMWVRVTAVTIAMMMVLAALALTPIALGNKLEQQYEVSPQCRWQEDDGAGPGMDAARNSQRAFDSIEHVGYFGGGGTTGVGGCDRPLVVLDDIDVVQHYRSALPEAGWRVVIDDGQRLRAEREDMAFEVIMCTTRAGGVWAGDVADDGRAQCPEH